jgi:hypothetical protein
MKKLLAIISACIIVSLFLASCGSSLTIAKRHYRKGFYVELAKNTQSPKPVNTVERKALPSKKPLQAYSFLNSGKQIINTGINKVIGPISQSHKIGNEKSGLYKTSPIQTALLTNRPTNVIAKSSAFETERVFTDENEYHDGGGERAALSLLWIVIVILLILWLIGILAGDFGVGGLINILLVIALILLVLWLLRIV